MPVPISIAAAHVAAIFMYHHVSDAVLPGPYQRALTASRAEFEAQLTWLARRGCTAVTVSRIWADRSGASGPACEVALTFDDGYDDARTAEAMLKARGEVGTFYVTSGYVGAAGHLTPAEVRQFARDGMEIGSHTVRHGDLAASTLATVHDELALSAAALKALTAMPIATLAYPSGRYSAGVQREARAAGYQTAVSTQPGMVTAAADPYALPRYRINHGEGLALMQQVLSNVVGPARPPSGRDGPRGEAELRAIAWRRAAGNDRTTAAAIAYALLRRDFPEEITLVRVLKVPATTIAGITLSGSHTHAPITQDAWLRDVRAMVALAFAAAPSAREIDVWATVPVPVMLGAPVTGDMAMPTVRTVFSAAVRRGEATLGDIYMDGAWARQIGTLGPKPRRGT